MVASIREPSYLAEALRRLRGGSRTACALFGLALAVAIGTARSAIAHGPDVNLDHQVDVLDLQHTINLILAPSAAGRPGQGDVNADGVVDVVDVQLLANLIVGVPTSLVMALPSSFPVVNIGTPWSHQFQAYGGTPPYAWATTMRPIWVTVDASGALFANPSDAALATFDLTVADAVGNRVTRVVSLQAMLPNNNPIAAPDVYLHYAPGSLVVPAPGVLANDSDPDGHALIATLLTPPSHGVVVMQPTGGFEYTPSSYPVSYDEFVYRIADQYGGSADARVRIWRGNRPPETWPKFYEAVAGTQLIVGNSFPYRTRSGSLKDGDRDPEGDPFTVAVSTWPSFGTLQVNPDGHFSFDIPANAPLGDVTFQYSATDSGSNLASIETVTVRVKPQSDALLRVLEVTAPDPVPVGSNFTLSVTVMHEGSCSVNNFNSVQSVSVDLTLFGLSGSAALTFYSWSQKHVLVYEVTLMATAALQSGLKSLGVTVVSIGSVTAHGAGEVLFYTGTPIEVGQGFGPYPTVQAAVDACPPHGAVFIRNMTGIMWAPSVGLSVTKPMVITSRNFPHQPQNSAVEVQLAGPTVFTPDGMHEGLVLDYLVLRTPVNSSGSRSLVITKSMVLRQVSPGNTGGVGAAGWIEVRGVGVHPRFVRCGAVAGVHSNHWAGPPAQRRGGIVHIHAGGSATFQSCGFASVLMVAPGTSPISSGGGGSIVGGLICYDGEPNTSLIIEDCTLHLPVTEIYADSGVTGAALHVDGGDFVMRRSSVLSSVLTYNGAPIWGAAVSVVGNSSALIEDSFIIGHASGGGPMLGGALYVSGASALVLGASLVSGEDVGMSSSRGAGIVISPDSLLHAEHCRFEGSTSGDGACLWCDALPASAPVGRFPGTRFGQSALSFYNCEFKGLQSVGTGATMFVGESAPGLPDVLMTLTQCTVAESSSPQNAGFHLMRGSVTIIDSVLWNLGAIGFNHNSLRGTVTVSHTLAPAGLVPGHVVGSNGNVTGDPYALSGGQSATTVRQVTQFGAIQSPAIDAGSTTAASRGFDRIPFGGAVAIDVGQVDLGAKPLVRHLRLSQLGLFVTSITAAQMQSMYP